MKTESIEIATKAIKRALGMDAFENGLPNRPFEGRRIFPPLELLERTSAATVQLLFPLADKMARDGRKKSVIISSACIDTLVNAGALFVTLNGLPDSGFVLKASWNILAPNASEIFSARR